MLLVNNFFITLFFHLNKIVETIQSLGCYASQSTCGFSDLFVESLSQQQCQSIASIYQMNCNAHLECSYYDISSVAGMTSKWCLQMCNANNFVFGAIKS